MPTKLRQAHGGTKALDLRHDLRCAFWYWNRGELTLADWWCSLQGVAAHAVWSWSDAMPMAGTPGARRARCFPAPAAVVRPLNHKESRCDR
jgi:hypothetical protein